MRRSLKDLNRKELLEMLLKQEKEIERLTAELEQAQNELNNRKVKIQNVGSFAEAMLLLNGVYEDVDKAAKEFLRNIQERDSESKRILLEASKKAETIIAEAEKFREIKYMKMEENT